MRGQRRAGAGTARAGAVRGCPGTQIYPGSGMPGRLLVAVSRLPAHHGVPALPAPAATPRRAVPAGPVCRAPEPCCLLRSRDPSALRAPEGTELARRCR